MRRAREVRLRIVDGRMRWDSGIPYYLCDSCGNVDFRAALDGLAESMEGMKRLERAMRDGCGIDDRVGIETRRIYDS
jgi:hypothetical protein